MRTSTFSSRGRRRGAALLEFAMIATLFSLMLLGMIQFGIYQSTANTLWNLSREGARFASVGVPTDQNIKDYITRVAPPNISASKLKIALDPTPVRLSGQPVTIRLTYDMESKMIFPFVKALFGKDRVIPASQNPSGQPKTVTEFPYSTTSTMRVE